MIRPLVLAALALTAAVPAAAAERSFPVGGFAALALAGSPDVTVTTGRSQASMPPARTPRSTGSTSASRTARSRSAPSAASTGRGATMAG